MADSSLARLVAELRETLGDHARAPRLIRTVYGFGHAFCGEARQLDAAGGSAAAEASCWLVAGADETPLFEGEHLIGREPGCRVRIHSPRVSRHHARILVRGRRATIEDLGSKNGTYLEGRLLQESSALGDGGEICVGPALFVFRVWSAVDTTRTGSSPRARGRP